MSTVTVKVRGLEEIGKRMQELSRNLKRSAANRAIKKALYPMYSAAVRATPVRSGRTVLSWRITVMYDDKGQPTGYVRVPNRKAFYALFLELGHKVVSIERKGVKLRSGRWSGGRTKHVRGFVRGRYMLRNAYDRNSTTAINILAAEMSKEIDRETKRLGGK